MLSWEHLRVVLWVLCLLLADWHLLLNTWPLWVGLCIDSPETRWLNPWAGKDTHVGSKVWSLHLWVCGCLPFSTAQGHICARAGAPDHAAPHVAQIMLVQLLLHGSVPTRQRCPVPIPWPCFSVSGFNRVPTIFPCSILFLQQIFLTVSQFLGKLVQRKAGHGGDWAGQCWSAGLPLPLQRAAPLQHPHPFGTHTTPPFVPVCLSADGGPGAASADVREVLSTRTKRNR